MAAPLLHRHALECVFVFSELHELAALMAVCRDWQAAVLRMPSVGDTYLLCPPDSDGAAALSALLTSRLRRHVVAIVGWCLPLSDEQLCLLAERMPHLCELKCALPAAGDPAPIPVMPSWLVSVELSWTSPQHPAEQTNGVIAALGALQHLKNLTLTFYCAIAGAIRLTPLRALHSLQRMVLDGLRNKDRAWTDEQLADLRAMGQLQRLTLRPCDEGVLERLLAPGHSLQLRFLPDALRVQELTAPIIAALHSLPALVFGNFSTRTLEGVAALHGLPALTELQFACEVELPTGELLTEALRSCRQLQTLNLQSLSNYGRKEVLVLSSAALSDSFGCMPLLLSLTIHGAQLDSLAFLTTGELPHTLAELKLCNITPRLPPSELIHVLSLGALRSLELWSALSVPADEATVVALTPPSAALPKLTKSWFTRAVD